MRVTNTELPGVRLIVPDVYADERGHFLELWRAERYAEHGLPATFVQDNLSFSRHGVLRGLHYQNPMPQGKLVTVLQGEVFDVAVDVRAGSATFGRWIGHTLSAENRRQLYVPEGFAHGFVVTSQAALFHYKCTAPYDPATERAVRWDDPHLDIPWPVTPPVVSAKDRQAPLLHESPREHFVFDGAYAGASPSSFDAREESEE